MGISLSDLQSMGEHFQNALTVVDRTGLDQPLVYVNRAFTELTGYRVEEILGRNCRFLQGPKTDSADVGKVRSAIANRMAVFCDLLNHRKNGDTFYNRLVLLPLELDGKPHFIGMQIDSSSLVARATAGGKTFDDVKTSEAIHDRINTPLMVALIALKLEGNSERRAKALEHAFSQILETVKNLPFKGEWIESAASS